MTSVPIRSAVLLLCLVLVAGSDVRKSWETYAIKQVLQDDTGIIEWLGGRLEDIIGELGNPSSIDAHSCIAGLIHVIEGLANGDMWALSFIDSSAKIPNGLLQVNLNHLGMYDECVSINPNTPDPFTGMHCLVDFNIRVPDNMTFEIDGIKKKVSDLLGSNVITLTMGECYPSVCKPYIIQNATNLVFGKVATLSKNAYAVEVEIDPHDCHLSSRDVLQTSDWLVLGVVGLILFLTALSTTVDVFYFNEKLYNERPSSGELAVKSFSIYTNGKKLFDLETKSETMQYINGIKFLSICWVIIGHRYRYLILEPVANLIAVPHAFQEWFAAYIVSGPLAVDTFFAISGLLNMYMFMVLRSKQRRYNIMEIIGTYLHRYFRLTPVYALAIAFTSTLLYRLREGPVWDRIIRPVQHECTEGWWLNLLYVNNYFTQSGGYCMLQSWYLSADMQMFWLSPLVIYPLWRWPIFGYIQVGFLVILSVIIPSYVAWHFNIKAPVPLTTDVTQKNLEMIVLYLPTHTKFTAYVIGIFVGYVVYKIRQRQWRLRINKVVCSCLWAGSIGLMLFAVGGLYPVIQLDYEYNKFYSTFFIGFYHLFWSVGLAWVIIACESGFGGIVNSVLSWNGFGPLGKLTYCIYLVHVGVLLCDIGSVRQAIYYSDFFEIHSFLGDLVISIIVAIVFSLLVEAPFMTLEKLIFKQPQGNRVEPKSSDAEIMIPVEIHPVQGMSSDSIISRSTAHLLSSEAENPQSEGPPNNFQTPRGSEASNLEFSSKPINSVVYDVVNREDYN